MQSVLLRYITLIGLNLANSQNGIFGEDLIWRIEKIAEFGGDLFWRITQRGKFFNVLQRFLT